MKNVLTGGIVFLTDYASKRWAERHLKKGEKHDKVRGYVSLERMTNTGMSAGRYPDTNDRTALIHGAALILALVRCLYLALKKTGKLARFGYALILGGGLGNLNDRLTREGVTDFIRLPKAPGKHKTMVFNIADVAITVGAVIAVIGELVRACSKKK